MLESLESRRLCAAAVTVSQSGGLLTIKGGTKADIINVFERTDSAAGTVTFENQVAGTSQTFVGVTTVKVTGNKGNDQIFMAGSTVAFNANGDAGNDFLVISDLGTASSLVRGGDGDDDITINNANKTTVNGDGGADEIVVQQSVGSGKTFLFGDAGKDTFTTYAGVNNVNGGGDSDLLIDASGGTAVNTTTGVESFASF
jgi:hypothetical protein